MFTKATKSAAKLRMVISGPSGSGKTMTALRIAQALGGKIALADTEELSASKYVGFKYSQTEEPIEFDTLNVVKPFSPSKVGEIIDGAAAGGYSSLIFDSATAFWKSEGGLLQLIDEYCKKQAAKGGKYDSFAAWKVYDPIFVQHIQERILRAPLHVFVTLRAKQEHVLVEESGRKVVKKVGMQPEFREGFEYAMDLEGMMTMDHDLIVGKTRIPAIDGKVYNKPGAELATVIQEWLK